MDGSQFRILLVGYGEIARLAHIPALKSKKGDAVVVGLVDTNFSEVEVVVDNSITKKNNAEPSCSSAEPSSLPLKFASVHNAFAYFDGNIHAVSICTPKTVTLSVAWDVLKIATSKEYTKSKLLGILLEKPPGDDVDELKMVVEYGKKNGIAMFTACHTTACPARKIIDSWLFSSTDNNSPADEISNTSKDHNTMICTRRLESIHIIWKENVRKWHPGQTWISKRSGGGVTDMLFNPLSLLVSLFGLSLATRKTPPSKHGEEADKSTSSDESQGINNNKLITLKSANLVQPVNWEAPISGHAEMLMSIPLKLKDGVSNDEDTAASMMEVPIVADFAFDYDPSSNNCESKEEEEIWSIQFVESGSCNKNQQQCSLTMKDGGAQAYIGSERMTTRPTATYPLLPEYETLYDQFLGLLRESNQTRRRDKKNDEKCLGAPSIVDCTTMALLGEITSEGKYTVGPAFDF